jgi:hypothetical protein
VDWDGIGTFALFISSGAIGLGIIALKGYQARLASKLEWARLERGQDGRDDTAERLQELEEQVRNITERVEFTDQLLQKPTSEATDE